jgi:adenylate cyclase
MTTVTCGNCGTSSPVGRKFCAECGTVLPQVCPSCGESVTATQKFCPECGSALTGVTTPADTSASVTSTPVLAPSVPIPTQMRTLENPAEERRLVTALFCDLVGFTPLSERLDPEEVRDIQREYFTAMRSQIDRYGGTVQKYAGDAVLAFFGAPVAREDDAERAVLCALRMQGAIETVAARVRKQWDIHPAIRVGVNTGEVVSGVWEIGGRIDVDVTGDAINTAARFQSAAEPGEVLVGAETMHLTRRRIEYGEERLLTLKGKSEPVPAYTALGVRERFGERWETSEGATPLVGRDREMATLLDAWVRAQGGEGGQVTLIGDAGVGKSRLIAELIEKAAPAASVRVVRARCLSYGQNISLWLVADLLRSLFGIGEGDGLEEVRKALEVALLALLVRCDKDSQREALDVLGEVLGLPTGNSLVANAGAQIRRQALIRSLKLLLGALSERAPTVMVLEDLHWVDGASSEVLKEILGDVPGLRFLALVAQRPGWTAPWSEWGWTERLTLRPLGESDAAVLAGAVLGGIALSSDLETYVGERAGGNPFFVEELLRALQESGGLVQHNGSMSLAAGAVERLPSTLTEILLARLDRLDGDVRSVAQVASVIGRSFAVRLLARVMEREGTTLEPSLSALQQAEIAFPRRGSDLEYVFKHVTMREAAYNTLVQKRRRRLHLDTARAIAALYPTDEYVEIIAYHYGKTGEHAEAARWLERAGDRAAEIYANETAIANYEEARRRWQMVDRASSVLARLDEKLGKTLSMAGRYDEAIPVLERAVETYREIRDLEGAGRAASWLGRALSQRGNPQAALTQVEPMVELLAWSGPSPALASLHLVLSSILQYLGRYEEMLTAAEQAAEVAGVIGDERLLGSAAVRRGVALDFLGRIDEGMLVLREAIPLLERVGDLSGLRAALGNLGEAYRRSGQLEEAKRSAERALAVAERAGNPAVVGFSLSNLSEILLTLGGWQEAREYLERAEEVLVALPSANYTAQYIPCILGGVLLATGDWEGAERELQRALGMAETTGDRQALEGIHIRLAELDLLRGDPDAAITRLQPLAGQIGGSQVLIECTLAWAWLEQGDVTRARELAAGAVTRGRLQGEVLALVDALRVRGMVLRTAVGEEEAKAILEEGLTLDRSLPYPYAEARCLVELGRLEEALVIFQRLGAKKDVEQIEDMLRQFA